MSEPLGDDRQTMTRSGWSNVIVLSAGHLLAGIGVASGIAVGGVLAEQLSGSTAMAGLAQTCSILGTAVAAIPLAHLARARGRRIALATGYVVALAGVALVFVAVSAALFPLFLAGMALFGAATAAGLQSRFAAAEGVPASQVSRAMSIVLWATTVGAVAGPNLSQLGSEWGQRLDIEPLLGPYLFTGLGFVLAAAAIGLLMRAPRTPVVAGDTPSGPASTAEKPVRAVRGAAWREALTVPEVRLGVALTVTSHMVMVGVMVMTPVHLHHLGFGLDVVGLVLSVHIFGMYGASPVMGWIADRFGDIVLSATAVVVFAAALVVGATWGAYDMIANTAALGLLGLGWSAGVIAGSGLVTKHSPPGARFSVQGGTDALMNFGAAASAALAGILIAWGGITALNVAAACVLLPVVVAGVAGLARGRIAFRPAVPAQVAPVPDVTTTSDAAQRRSTP